MQYLDDESWRKMNEQAAMRPSERRPSRTARRMTNGEMD
jgi:hypothetical protein